MLRIAVISIFLLYSLCCFAQTDERVSVIEFVQVIDNQMEETVFYYENNWKQLREVALSRGYIESYQLVELPYSDELPAHFMLLTNFENQAQYDLAEKNFGELIKERGDLKLLNEKKPNEFKKNIISQVSIKNY